MCFPLDPRRGRLLLLAGVSSILLLSAQAASAQAQVTPTVAAAPASAADAAADVFSRQEIETLVAPVALYPDALLAQVLPASVYPLEIVQASRWLARNKEAAEKQDFSGADAQTWDPSVKALLRFPAVMEKLNADLDWTTDLGDAFANQPQDVATAVQVLRAQAAKAGALQSNSQQKVVQRREADREIIIIEPANPEVIYVPAYDPVKVYSPGPSLVATALVTFGTAVAIGAIFNSNDCWNWGTGAVYRPVWPGYPAWRPPYPAWRPGMPTRPGGVNSGNNINIGNSVNIGNNIKPWRPDPERYRPGLGSKPGLAARPVAGQSGPRQQVQRPDNDRPLARPEGRPDARPDVRPASRPEARPNIRPETRPASNIRPSGAFGGVEAGSAAGAFANRGQASRDKMQRPAMNRPQQMSRPAAQRPAMNRPSGGGRPAARGNGNGGGRGRRG